MIYPNPNPYPNPYPIYGDDLPVVTPTSFWAQQSMGGELGETLIHLQVLIHCIQSYTEYTHTVIHCVHSYTIPNYTSVNHTKPQ